MSKLVVVLGDHNNEEEDEGEEQRLVDQVVLHISRSPFLFCFFFCLITSPNLQVVLHPKYTHANYNNDLALLRLQRPVTFTK